MSKEKQIEEMAKIYYEAMLRAHPIDVANGKASTYYATAFYNAGYRKQSEGEWILCERLYDYEVDTWKCSQCQTFIRDDEKRKMKFCPNCGAKMSGGAN